jgi:hypothetical protein
MIFPEPEQIRGYKISPEIKDPHNLSQTCTRIDEGEILALALTAPNKENIYPRNISRTVVYIDYQKTLPFFFDRHIDRHLASPPLFW